MRPIEVAQLIKQATGQGMSLVLVQESCLLKWHWISGQQDAPWIGHATIEVSIIIHCQAKVWATCLQLAQVAQMGSSAGIDVETYNLHQMQMAMQESFAWQRAPAQQVQMLHLRPEELADLRPCCQAPTTCARYMHANRARAWHLQQAGTPVTGIHLQMIAPTAGCIMMRSLRWQRAYMAFDRQDGIMIHDMDVSPTTRHARPQCTRMLVQHAQCDFHIQQAPLDAF